MVKEFMKRDENGDFYFHIERKVVLWKTDYYTIEAGSVEEAKALIISKYEAGDLFEGDDDEIVTWIDDSHGDEELVEPVDYATEEVYFIDEVSAVELDAVVNNFDNYVMLIDNAPLIIQRQRKLDKLLK